MVNRKNCVLTIRHSHIHHLPLIYHSPFTIYHEKHERDRGDRRRAGGRGGCVAGGGGGRARAAVRDAARARDARAPDGQAGGDRLLELSEVGRAGHGAVPFERGAAARRLPRPRSGDGDARARGRGAGGRQAQVRGVDYGARRGAPAHHARARGGDARRGRRDHDHRRGAALLRRARRGDRAADGRRAALLLRRHRAHRRRRLHQLRHRLPRRALRQGRRRLRQLPDGRGAVRDAFIRR